MIILRVIYSDYFFFFSAVGDLASFSEQTDHYHAEHGYTTSLFTPASRPHCINVAYEKACITPIPALRHCNLYRADGKTGSKLFTLSPIVLEDQYVDDPEMEMPPRKVKGYKKNWSPLKLTNYLQIYKVTVI